MRYLEKDSAHCEKNCSRGGSESEVAGKEQTRGVLAKVYKSRREEASLGKPLPAQQQRAEFQIYSLSITPL